MHKTLVHTIRDRSPHTKKDLEELGQLIERGYFVEFAFNFKNEWYYLMLRHGHEDFEEEKQSN